MNKISFFDRVGKIALGSRLRMLSERITSDAVTIYQSYGVELQPKWFPVFYILSKEKGMTITDISREIGHSHPSVSKIVREMSKNGLVVERKGKKDKRQNVVSLSKKGQTIIQKIEKQYADVDAALNEIFSQTQHDLWQAMDEFEYLLDKKNWIERVREKKKEREAKNIEVVDYMPKYKSVFKTLNEEWIVKYFKIEPMDTKILSNPKRYIINKGGYIKIALFNNTPVGVCSLIPLSDSDYDFELAKMAVSPKDQGLGIGWILGQAIIQQVKQLGGKKLYLESNTKLIPAIKLYEKMGFKKIVGHASPYKRSNIQMVLNL